MRRLACPTTAAAAGATGLMVPRRVEPLTREPVTYPGARAWRSRMRPHSNARTMTLFKSQRSSWISGGRARGRQYARDGGDGHQHDRRGNERRRVERLDAEERRLHEARERRRDCQPRGETDRG